ncbi:MAG: circadian clock protein KaiC [Planctomycetes bacterium]|nr:circadian clock protein KaiC [Planctomycetota bacterium]
MARQTHTPSTGKLPGVEKCPTGIRGLDEITDGGLPRGRPTLVCGGAGSGKTLLAMEFIVRGIRDYGEPGVFVAFEETADELSRNVSSLGFDLDKLVRRRQLAVDHIRVERSEMEETGEYDLEGLFIRLGTMIDQIGAQRIAIDTVEVLFAGLLNEAILRAELRRLLRWLKDKGVTTIITGEQGEKTLTRHGLEEYVSDCVIFLDHRIVNQIATRRLRVVKYRGSSHGTNEYPTMIDQHGLSVLPISSLGLDYGASTEHVSSGVDRLDAMLGGGGYYRGSSILVSGTAGTGKTSLAAAFIDAACRRGERCLYLVLEEAPAQIIRNMASIGFDLGRWVDKGSLRFHGVRSTLYGLEQHLVTLHKLVSEFHPPTVAVDPITNLMVVGETAEVKSTLTRMIDFLKNQGITALFTSLTEGGGPAEQTEVGVSSLMDTWLLLRNVEMGAERNRLMFILKSRGMAHSNQVREFRLSDQGIQLRDVYVGPSAVLTGAARLVQEARDKAQAVSERESMARRRRELQQEQALTRAQFEALHLKTAALDEELHTLEAEDQTRRVTAAGEQAELARAQGADGNGGLSKKGAKRPADRYARA